MQNSSEPSIDTFEKELADASTKLQQAKKELCKAILGQDKVIDLTLTAIASGGHLILLGVPGLAKTKIVESIGHVLGLDTNRIQCTPDLMPADIVGSEILDDNEQGKRHFKFMKGPVFSQLLMADEINRASPRTQSALLQAMQEKKVTIGGKTYDLPKPFHVLATQNPLEQEGTYPLPEAQLDRFMMEVKIDYPDLDAERAMVIATTTGDDHKLSQILNAEDLVKIHSLIQSMPLAESVLDTIINLIRAARPDSSSNENIKKYVVWAPGPRAAQALSLAVRAHALVNGREIASNEDIRSLAYPILQHRMSLNARTYADGQSIKALIDSLVNEHC